MPGTSTPTGPQVDDFDVIARFRQVFSRMIEEHSNLGHLSHLLDIEYSTLKRSLESKRGARDPLKSRVLAALERPARFFFFELLVEGDEATFTAADAALYLRTCFDDPHLQPDRFLSFLQKGVARWLAAPNAAEPDPALRAEILGMERERAYQPQDGRARSVALLRRLLADDAAPVAGGDLALALAQWAIVRRTEGSRADSRDAYILAFEVVALRRDLCAEGMLFRYASLLLSDFERERWGIRFCDLATGLLGTAGEYSWIPPCSYYRGILFVGRKRFATAEYWYRLALENFGENQQHFRQATLQSITQCQLERGEGRLALETIARIKAESISSPLATAYLAWLSGRALLQLRHLEMAERELQAALVVIGSLGEPLDAAMATLDLAIALLRMRKTDRLKSLVDEISPRLSVLKKNRRAEKVLIALNIQALEGKLSELWLKTQRHELAESARPAVYRRRKVSRQGSIGHKSPNGP